MIYFDLNPDNNNNWFAKINKLICHLLWVILITSNHNYWYRHHQMTKSYFEQYNIINFSHILIILSWYQCFRCSGWWYEQWSNDNNSNEIIKLCLIPKWKKDRTKDNQRKCHWILSSFSEWYKPLIIINLNPLNYQYRLSSTKPMVSD